MPIAEKTNSIQRKARIAGGLILLLAVIAPFSMLYLPSILVVPGNATATANNIIASEGLFRLGAVADSLVLIIEIVLTVLLYVLLAPVSNTLSLIAAFSRFAMTIVQAVNLFNHAMVLLLVGGAAYLTVFAPDQVHAQILLFLNAHQYGVYVWEIFFGFHLIVLGYLVFRSGYLPRILGLLLMLGSLGYLVESSSHLLLSDTAPVTVVQSILLALSAIGELAFGVWLLVKGVNVELWKKRVSESD